MLEVHDTTGYGEDGAAVSLARAAEYWISIQSVLAGQEAYVLINIGNEPYGNVNAAQWVTATKAAIARLREAGFAHALVADAPNWGQDWSFTMRDNAASVLASDPLRNVIFDVHMYGVFDTAGEVEAYLKAFVNARLPIMVGEFGHNHSDGNPDENAIMAWAETLGVGYLAWSWSGNGGGVEYLDLVANFNPSSLTTWGDRVVTGANGLRVTAREATVYGSQPATPTATPRPPTATPTATPQPSATPTPQPGGCQVKYTITNQWPGGFTADVLITNTGAAINGWALAWAFGGDQRITNAWNAAATQSGQQVMARNVEWNAAIAPGGTASLGFQATFSGANAKPASFRLNGAACAVAP